MATASRPHQGHVEMFYRGRDGSMFPFKSLGSQPIPPPNESYDTEFEEDMSDSEEYYSGRRSEDSASFAA